MMRRGAGTTRRCGTENGDMRALHPITPAQLPEVLLRVSLARPVHLWGAPGIGKSTMVEAFARDLGMDCVTLMATQLAPLRTSLLPGPKRRQ